MSELKRICCRVPEETYKKYRTILLKEGKTVQDDLKGYIIKKIKEGEN